MFSSSGSVKPARPDLRRLFLHCCLLGDSLSFLHHNATRLSCQRRPWHQLSECWSASRGTVRLRSDRWVHSNSICGQLPGWVTLMYVCGHVSRMSSSLVRVRLLSPAPSVTQIVKRNTDLRSGTLAGNHSSFYVISSSGLHRNRTSKPVCGGAEMWGGPYRKPLLLTGTVPLNIP